MLHGVFSLNPYHMVDLLMLRPYVCPTWNLDSIRTKKVLLAAYSQSQSGDATIWSFRGMNTESVNQSRGASELFSTKIELNTWPKHVSCPTSTHTGG
jgi:hypothetical protein